MTTDAGFRRVHRFAAVAVFLLLGALSLRQIGSPDVGFHLRSGSAILAGEGWPARDRFTYTLTDRPYVDTSWGYQVLLAGTYRAAGAPGLVLLHATALLALFATLLATARLAPAEPATLLLLLALGVLVGEDRYEIRPEVFSYLLLAQVLRLLHQRAETGRAPLFLLPLILLVWANFHSFFVLGWVAIGCFLLPGVLPGRRFDRALAAAGGASVLISLVNPYGWRAVALAASLLSRFRASSPLRPHVAEFQSPSLALDSPTGACLLAVLALAAAALPGLVRTRRGAPVLLALIAGALALRMSRNVPLLAVLALPGTAWGLRTLLAPLGAGARGRASLVGPTVAALVGGGALLLACRVATDAYYLDLDRNDRFGLGWNRLRLPIDATRFARRAGLEGNVLNHIAFGGYLMWQLGRPVFIDGRLELAGDQAFVDYLETLRSPEALERAVRRHRVTWMVFPYFGEMGLLRRLRADRRWRLAYHDHLAVIFVRAERPIAADGLDASPDHALLSSPPAPLPGLAGVPLPSHARCFLDGFVHRARFPVEANGDGNFHLACGETEIARAFFAYTIVESRGCRAAPYQNLAVALLMEGRPAAALAPLEVARKVRDDGSLRELEERIRGGVR